MRFSSSPVRHRTVVRNMCGMEHSEVRERTIVGTWGTLLQPDLCTRRNKNQMRILLYNPDNGVTRNFMPHLWMFLLQSLTPPDHEVLLIDGNAQPMDEAGIARYVREQKIGLVGIGAMTRMIAKAYRMADAVRAARVPVVMGGPHVT